MTKEEIKEAMQEGFNKVIPIAGNVTNELMKAYQIGFETCFKMLTGEEF